MKRLLLSTYFRSRFAPAAKARFSKKTETNYADAVGHFIALIGDMPIKDIREEHLATFSEKLASVKRLRGATIKHLVKRLRSIVAAYDETRKSARDDAGKLVPNAVVLGRIGDCAVRLAQGEKLRDVAKSLGVTSRAVLVWKEDYPQIWDAAIDSAMAAAMEIVRRRAGTDAVFEDPAGHMKQATACERWANRKSIELFPGTGKSETLTAFFRRYYSPVQLGDAQASTRRYYGVVLRRWRLLTGDPPLEEITNQTLACYRNALAAMVKSPNTVRSQLTMIQAVIDKAGKPCRYNRDAAGVIDEPPWVKKPKAVDRLPVVLDDETLNAVYRTADRMTKPPAAWWRALLVFTFNTGIRSGTLFRIENWQVDWRGGILTLSADFLRKSRRDQVFPLNAVTMHHLEAIRRPSGLLFERPYSLEYFRREFHRLQQLAGIPPEARFGLHALRRTHATRLWRSSPQAAQYQLGHASLATTMGHYVDGTELVGAAIQSLPQPDAWG